MELRQLFLILQAHRWLILGILFSMIAAAVGLTLVSTKMYTATTSVVIDFENRGPFEQSAQGIPLSPGYVSTQVDIARSRTVAAKVAEKLSLKDSPQVQAQFQTETKGVGDFNDWAAARLLGDLSVDPQRESRVVEISYESNDPEVAALVANAFADSYIETSLELNTGPAKLNSVWLQEQLKTLRAQVEEAQARMTAYQQKNQILDGDDRLNNEMSRFTDLQGQYSAAHAQVQDVHSRQLGENHPQYQRAIAQERAVLAAMNEQKARVLRLKQGRGDISVLQREVESAQRTYDAALQRYNQTSLEGQSKQTAVSILNRAVPPRRPSSPNMMLNVVVAFMLGSVLAVSAALLREIVSRRIRTEADVVRDLGLPSFGVLERAEV